MPELLRLRTPDFEFSVWANNISARMGMYQTSLGKRGDLSELPTPFVRFSPAQSVTQNYMQEYPDAKRTLAKSLQIPEPISELTLNAPLFFENTQYQFEWVFFEPVELAFLSHRSQAVNEAFRFAKQRGALPARLTGTINTGNDVGWVRLPLSYQHEGKSLTQHIAFEVLPTKIALHKDLPAMYHAIDNIFPLWRFSLVEKTELDATQGEQRGRFPLMWLANFGQLRERFEQGLKVICTAPHSRLQATAANIKTSKLKGRLPCKLEEQVKQDLANGKYDKRYRVEKKQLSVDTPENRFIKMAVIQSKRQLADFEQRLRASNQAPDRQRLSDAFLNELHSWQQPLQKMLGQSFLKEVGQFSGLNLESLVLQQKTGYSAVYRVWQELKFYLDVLGTKSSISMKSVAEIYEIWCFIQIRNMLEVDLGFGKPKHRQPKLKKGVLGELDLINGDKGAFEFYRERDGVEANLYHEKAYRRDTKEVCTFLLTHKPDIVLEVILPNGKEFIWLFDAKYRIESIKTSLTNVFLGKPTSKERDKWSLASYEERKSLTFRIEDGVPDDAINQMHRYRDALIRLSDHVQAKNNALKRVNKSRPVFGAFALYPGFFDQANEVNPYADAIEEIGIGAFALLPGTNESSEGYVWLLDFLKEQIGHNSKLHTDYHLDCMAEKLYIQESARIPYHGMRQVLYPDLVMTVTLCGQRGRKSDYFKAFENGNATWYHLPKKTFDSKFKQHIAFELSYLGIASNSVQDSGTKQIDKIWPVQKVFLKSRHEITAEQAGKDSDSNELYYLFLLGTPLSLQKPITKVPHRPVKNAMNLTTLRSLGDIQVFNDLERVYKEAFI